VVPPTRSSRTDVHDDILGSYRTLPSHEDKSPIVWGEETWEETFKALDERDSGES